MTRRTLLELGAMLALGVNYAGAWVIAFIWNWPDPDSELYVHLLVMLVVSLLFGSLIVDIKRTLFYTIGSIIMGIGLATILIAMPAILAESAGGIDASVSVALSAISKLFVVSVPFLMIGVFAGCFVGDAFSEIEHD
ncbi:MAG TPA: hypothetical protein VJ249_02575 [Candidatus Bathyarchaeia archaeon]|nr:hypothetical protein [Candidatus Bathyarchaeia archaeon]